MKTNPTLTLTIPGEPRGKGRPRFTRSGHVYTDAATREYEDHVYQVACVALMGRDEFPLKGPIEISFEFYMERPRRPLFDVPAVKPDLSNLVKGVEDALEKAGVYVNDSRIVKSAECKSYSPTPGVIVRVWKR